MRQVDAVSHLRPADPIALHALDAVVPVEAVQVVQETLRELSDAQHPLPHGHADHGMRPALGLAIYKSVQFILSCR